MDFVICKPKLNNMNKIDNMLTSLIQDERKNYNSNINENYEVKNFYEQYIENENMCILVAKENENYMGYIYGFIQENWNLFNNKTAQLDALFVKEQYRGNGIAKSLMKEFINWSKEKGTTYVELSVCKDNTNAISLYEDEGFYIDKILLKKKL